MDVSHIIDDLNDPQREAVCAPSENVLVLAGAGSGKTRVLVHRICLADSNRGGFTLQHPRSKLLPTGPQARCAVALKTCLNSRLAACGSALSIHWPIAYFAPTGKMPTYRKPFQILDSEDQQRAIKRVIRSLDLDDNSGRPNNHNGSLMPVRTKANGPEHIEHFDDPYQKRMIHIYQAYEAMCQRSGLVDFAELLLRAHELWLKKPHILDHYQSRFRIFLSMISRHQQHPVRLDTHFGRATLKCICRW